MSAHSSRNKPLNALALSAFLFCVLTACQLAPSVSAPELTPTAAAPSVTPTATDTPPPTAAPTATFSPTPSATPTAIPTPRPFTPTPTLMPQAERRKIFEQVWQTLKDRYVYRDQVGKSWDAWRQEYEPKALAAASANDFYDVVGRMVSQLRDGHTYYLSPWIAHERDVISQGAQAKEDIGILYALNGGELVINYVIPHSPADEAGLKRREHIVEIDGKGASNVNLLRGAEGSVVALRVRATDDSLRTVSVTHHVFSAKVLPSAYRLPSDARIGYLYIPTFRPNDMDKEVETALQKLADGEPLDGLIIDVRSNGGGSRSVLRNVMGHFTQGESGRFYTTRGSTPFSIRSSKLFAQYGALPLVVLIDERSASASELLSGILQFQKRATVIGVRSMGSLRVTFFHDFADGSRLGVSEESFKLPNGFDPDQRGITPDIALASDWFEYAEADDPHLLQAVACLRRGCGK